MIRARLFVEGEADIKFLQDVASFYYGITLEKGKHIIECSGKGGLQSKKEDFLESALRGLTNCIIFDADSEKQGTTFQSTKERIEGEVKEIASILRKEKPKVEATFDVFLFPNHREDGDLETLLERIINPNNQPILDCWNSYEHCLQSLQFSQPLTLPIRKHKMYTYSLVLHGRSESERNKARERNRDYTNTKHWTLSSSATEPLKTFLDQYFRKETSA